MTVNYGTTGLLQTSNPNTVAELVPVNTQQKPVEVGTNALRLLAVARAVPLANTGDAAVVPVINSAAWSAATVVFANGLVSGVPTTVAAAGVGIFTGAASTGTTVRTQGVLIGQIANASIAAAAASAAVQSTAQSMYINVGTALANATVDVFVYGYDQT
jgi:hypothetical protein